MRFFNSMKLVQKSIQFVSDYWLKGSIVLSQLLFSVAAFADDPGISTDNNLGAVAAKVSGEMTTAKNAMWAVAQVAGIAFALGGIRLWIRISNEQSQKSKVQAATMVVLGAGAFFLPTVMGAGAGTFFTGST